MSERSRKAAEKAAAEVRPKPSKNGKHKAPTIEPPPGAGDAWEPPGESKAALLASILPGSSSPVQRSEKAADLLQSWRADLLASKHRVRYCVGTGGFDGIEIGPELVTLIGAPPGWGKTALVMQWVIDGLRLNPDLRVLVANVEMPPSALLDRQISRLSGIPARLIRERRIAPELMGRFETGYAILADVSPRLCFVRQPFTIGNIVRSADAFGANWIVMDYVQRIVPDGDAGSRKDSLDAVMNYARAIADHGLAVLLVSAVGRQRNANGQSSYDNLNLSSFRESSELEFGCDDAFLLKCPDSSDRSSLLLSQVKSRYGEMVDLDLKFNRSVQHFDTVAPAGGDS